MTTSTPLWTDSGQGDLLALVATGPMAPDTAGREWGLFLDALHTAADANGRISPNRLRELTRGRVAPQRCGAFTHRALSRGLVSYSGEFEVSDDTAGRNGGKPCRVLRWIGGAL